MFKMKDYKDIPGKVYHTDIVLINLDKDKDRLKESVDELSKFGLTFKRIPGIKDEIPGRGFSLATINALKAIPNGGIILEDDVELVDFWLPELPEGWDMIYFGANLTEDVERVNDDLVRVFGAWTTHAILYSKKAVSKILKEYDYETCGIYDGWLRKTFLRNNKCYMVTPMQAYQRDSWSNILKHRVSYRNTLDFNYNKFIKKADK